MRILVIFLLIPFLSNSQNTLDDIKTLKVYDGPIIGAERTENYFFDSANGTLSVLIPYHFNENNIEQTKEELKDFDYQNNRSTIIKYKKFENKNLIDENNSRSKELSISSPIIGKEAINFVIDLPGIWRILVILMKDHYVLQLETLESLIHKVPSKDKTNFIIHSPNRIDCERKSITLAKQPNLNRNEIIEGIIDLKSNDYINFRDENEIHYSFEIEAYFKIKIPNKLDSLNR